MNISDHFHRRYADDILMNLQNNEIQQRRKNCNVYMRENFPQDLHQSIFAWHPELMNCLWCTAKLIICLNTLCVLIFKSTEYGRYKMHIKRFRVMASISSRTHLQRYLYMAKLDNCRCLAYISLELPSCRFISLFCGINQRH